MTDLLAAQYKPRNRVRASILVIVLCMCFFFLSFETFERYQKVKPLVVMVNRKHLNSRWWDKPQMHSLRGFLGPRRQNNGLEYSCVSFTKTHVIFLSLSEKGF